MNINPTCISLLRGRSFRKTIRYVKIIAWFYLLVFSKGAFSQCTQLVWQDEFNTPSLDLTKWSYEVGNGCAGASGCGFGNSELQYYTSGTNNITVSGGNLVITARHQPNYLGSGNNYTSGKITTLGKQSWLYGRMEARMQVPSGNAAWPAFWMLSDNNNWPYTGEIDIAETQNNNPTTLNQTIHYYCNPCGNNQNTGVAYNNGTNWSSGFHIYAVDWTPNQIRYSVDGITTATFTPADLVGGTATAWPFNSSNFYAILNLAIGGSYTGYATPNNAQFPLTMLVDYVRVYSNPSSLIISGQKTVFVGDQKYYGITSAGGAATYNWTLPAGATIVSGQGTNNILVNWGAAVAGNVTCTVDGDGAGTTCTPVAINYAVKAIVKTCGIILDDFQTNRNIGDMYANGTLSVVANPAAGGSNTSTTVGRYDRNAGFTYDILGYGNFLVDNADDFRTGARYFTMDVRTNAPAGTPITIEFDNSIQMVNAYPDGRHSQYTAVTGAPNTWNKLTFAFSQSPDAALTAADVDRLQILFNPNSNVPGQVFYFDNLTAQAVSPVTSAITGNATACLNQSGVTYAVVARPNSTYAWTVPAGATITSGQGTNSITVTFGTTSGNVSVVETNAAKCVGTAVTRNVTVSGSCILTANFTATPLSTCAGNTIVFTNTSSGTSGGETYAWNFGPGATPATANSAGPISVTYSTGGAKTVSLTVTNGGGPNTNTKTNYITISNPPTTCIYADDFDNGAVNFNTSSGSFTHTETGTVRRITTAGHGEWDNFVHTLNNGTVATPLNFQCAANKPVLKIRARASANCLLRVTMLDGAGRAVDNYGALDLPLTTTYQTFTIDYAQHFMNYYGPSPGPVDSTNITQLQFYINPGFASFPIGPYTAAFVGTVDIDWEGIGANCNVPATAPTITGFTPSCGTVATAVTITGTNLSGATAVLFNGTAGTITSNSATQLVVNAPTGVTAGTITVQTPSGNVTSAASFNLSPAQPSTIVAGTATPCPGSTGNTYTVTSVAGVTYNWTYSGTGHTITAGAGTNSITVSYSAGATNGTWTVTPSVSGCNGTARTLVVTLGAVPLQPSIITPGTASPCQGSVGNTYTVLNVAGVTYNWTYSGSGSTITSGAGSYTITASYTPGATNGTWTVTPSNACGNGTARTLAVTLGAVPLQPSTIVAGTATPCPSSTGNTYTVTSVAGVTYNWTYSGTGQTITAGAGTNAITVSYASGTNGTWTVTPSNACGNGTARTLAVTLGAVPAQPSTIVAGTATPCPSSTGNTYTVTSVAGVTYTWTYSGTGQTITAGAGTNAITVSYASGTNGTWTVTPSNACGNGTARTLAVTLGVVPLQPSVITPGTATPCATSTGNTYTVTNVAGVSYNWTYSGTGQTITAGSGTNSITVSYASGTNGTWTVTPSNACGNGTARTLAVTLGAVPAQPSAIVAGTASPCATSTGNTYTVTNVAGVTYNWIYSGTGATITAGSNTNAITVSYASGTNGTWTVTPSNACGNGTARTLAVTLGAAPTQPSAIVGTTTLTQSTTGNGFSVTNVAGVTYNWTYSGTGGTINNVTTNSITLDLSGSATGGTLSVTATNACGTSTAQTTTITVNPATVPQPSPFTSSSATVCQGATGVVYTVPNVVGTTYNWNYSGTGFTITSGSGTNSIVASFSGSATSGTISVVAQVGPSTSTPRTLAVTVNSAPLQPSAITPGTATPCATSTGNTYTVTNVAGVSYNWVYSGTGQTITAGSGTNAITVSYASGTNGTWTVTPSNACGNGTARTLAVTVNAVPLQPSVITPGTATPCATSTGNTYTVTNVAGVSYNWVYSGTGQTITAGSGTNAITVSYASGTNGTWTVTPSNACGNGTARTLAVTLGAAPAQPSAIVGTTTLTQSTTGNGFSVTNVAGVTYNWTYSGTGGTINNGTTNSITLDLSGSATGGTLSVTATNACGTSTAQTTTITVNPATVPQPSPFTSSSATVCQGATGVVYTVPNVVGTTYNWSYSGTGFTITSGSGTNSIVASFSGSATSGTLSVVAQVGPSTSTPRTLAVTVNSAPLQPSAITGLTTVNTGQSGVAYSVTNVVGVTYNWSYTGTGGTVVGSGNSITINYSGSATSGNVSVTATNGCGTSTSSTLAVSVGTAPSTPGGITGSTSVTQGQTGVTYSVPNVVGVTYTWTYVGGSGATITGTGNSITIDFSGSATSGTLSVTATNAFGTSPASTLPITLTSPGTPQPGLFTSSSATVCQGQDGVVYTVPNVAGTTYSWSYSGSDVIINGNTNSVTVDFGMNATSGTLSVVANNGSGASAPRTIAVVVNAIATQPVSITGPSTVSGGQTNLVYFVANQAGVTFTWSYTGTGANITSGQGTSMIAIDFDNAATSGNLSVVSSNLCGPSSSTTLPLNVLPTLGLDDAEGVSYSLNVYPNPAVSFATVEMKVKNAGKMDLGVYDMLGTEVKVLLKNEMLVSDTYTFSIDDLAYGVYLVKAKSGEETMVVKLIKY